MSSFLRVVLAFCALLVLGCGYKPIAQNIANILGNSVYVNVKINKQEPQNSVWINDAVREGVVSRLHLGLAQEDSASSSILVSIKSIDYQALSYDELGYITSYKVKLSLNFSTTFKNGEVVEKTTSAEHDFSISRKLKDTRFADSVISDAERFEAIKEASKEAFDEYISYLAILGIKG